MIYSVILFQHSDGGYMIDILDVYNYIFNDYNNVLNKIKSILDEGVIQVNQNYYEYNNSKSLRKILKDEWTNMYFYEFGEKKYTIQLSRHNF